MWEILTQRSVFFKLNKKNERMTFKIKQWERMFSVSKCSYHLNICEGNGGTENPKRLRHSQDFQHLPAEVLPRPGQSQLLKILLQKFRLEQCYRCTTLISYLGLSKPCFSPPVSSFVPSPFCPRNAAGSPECWSISVEHTIIWSFTHFLGWLLSFWRGIFEDKLL